MILETQPNWFGIFMIFYDLLQFLQVISSTKLTNALKIKKGQQLFLRPNSEICALVAQETERPAHVRKQAGPERGQRRPAQHRQRKRPSAACPGAARVKARIALRVGNRPAQRGRRWPNAAGGQGNGEQPTGARQSSGRPVQAAGGVAQMRNSPCTFLKSPRWTTYYLLESCIYVKNPV